MSLKNITEAKDLKGKRVLVRLDLNVPIVDNKVGDDFRILAAMPMLTSLREAGAKIVAISHIEGKGGESLKPVADYFAEKNVRVTFISEYFTDAAQTALDAMKEGDMVLFENLRINKGEKENDETFAKQLAAMGDVYVNEAFPVSHRAHASIVGVPKFLPSFAGPTFMREVENLSQAFTPDRPFLFILGGAKFDTKMPLIQKFLKLADSVFVGGALANNFFKELGMEIGESLVSPGNFNLPEMLETKKVFVPSDAVVQSAEGSNEHVTKSIQEIGPKDKIWDAGAGSLVQLEELVNKSKFILWNGPLGNYEEGFSEGTKKLAEIISASGAKSIVGGGDTVAAIQTLGLMDKFTFVSTGGGAMLDFLSAETLPGIDALKNSK